MMLVLNAMCKEKLLIIIIGKLNQLMDKHHLDNGALSGIHYARCTNPNSNGTLMHFKKDVKKTETRE
ncbi:hypothetical protein T02_343 [Trichinella nativa]|uniref:Uncharacterized protein n=1 Tax=Trichinella nativa TaxID=6335 RepID=A0A0V1L8S7_9BILA|nr:hypothetical protein T02_343 [Trichinella nativa]